MTTYFVDTNILVSLTDPNRSQHPVARQAVATLRRQRHRLVIAFQNCTEFWNVATRPVNRNGLGFSIDRANAELELIERAFTILPATPSIYPIWRRLVVTYGVSGAQVHDAHLVASMQAHGVSHILTFNTADFAHYAGAGVAVVDPATV